MGAPRDAGARRSKFERVRAGARSLLKRSTEMSTQDSVDKRSALSRTTSAPCWSGGCAATWPAPRRARPSRRMAGPGPEHPASFAQERMWFLTPLDPDKPLYNVPVAMLVPADVNVPFLERALTKVISRHEALRTSFRMGDDGQLRQIVHEPFPMKVEVRDVAPPRGRALRRQRKRPGGRGGLAPVRPGAPAAHARDPAARVGGRLRHGDDHAPHRHGRLGVSAA